MILWPLPQCFLSTLPAILKYFVSSKCFVLSNVPISNVILAYTAKKNTKFLKFYLTIFKLKSNFSLVYVNYTKSTITRLTPFHSRYCTFLYGTVI